MKWVFWSLLAANLIFAITVQLREIGEPQASRVEVNPKKIKLVSPAPGK